MTTPTRSPDVLHYRGDVTESLAAMIDAGHLFGPDACGPAAPGQIIGHGAFWELTGAEYDPATDITTASFKPYVDPRARVRYHGGDGSDPDEIGAPTLHTRDRIRGR